MTDEFERLIAFVPESAMIVRVFPMDPVLMGLQLATDVDRMGALLALHLHSWRSKRSATAEVDLQRAAL